MEAIKKILESIGVKNATLAAALIALTVAAVPLAFKLDARYAKQQKLDEVLMKVSEIQLDINSLKAKQDILLDEQKADRETLNKILFTQGEIVGVLKMQNSYEIEKAKRGKLSSSAPIVNYLHTRPPMSLDDKEKLQSTGPPAPEAKPAKKPNLDKQLLDHRKLINKLAQDIDEIKSSLPNKTDK